MIYQIHLPLPPLSEFIEHFFYYEGYAAAHSMEKFLPDGSMDLLIDLTDTPKKLFYNEEGTNYTSFRKSWMSGMKTEYILIDASVSCMIGVHFKPGGAYPFFNLPMSELNDLTIETDVFWHREVDDLRESILQCKSIPGKFALLEKHFLQKGGMLEPNIFIKFAIGELQRSPGVWSINRLARKTGYTQKHLIQLFKKYVGLSPKQFSRIMRFQKVIRELETNQSIEWTSLALDSGFYDQAHFIREFQAFSGINPSTYMVERGEYRDYLPVRQAG
jgi:AraC-like DNA-binding protein